jgi:hypothetical protein
VGVTRKITFFYKLFKVLGSFVFLFHSLLIARETLVPKAIPIRLSPEQIKNLKIAPQTEWSTCARPFVPQLLPYKKARIDVFILRDEGSRYVSSLKNFDQEFLVLSIEGVVRGAGLISSGTHTTDGKGGLTPAGRYYIFALDRDHRQMVEDEETHEIVPRSWMPYDIMLASRRPIYSHESKRKSLNQAPVLAQYTKRNFHGTDGYGYDYFGQPASHGCIRNFTSEDIMIPYTNSEGRVLENEPKRLQRWGLHRINWKYLNPYGWDKVDLIPNRGQNRFVNGRSWENNWFEDYSNQEGYLNLANGTAIGLEEMSQKVRIEFHDFESITQRTNRKELFEKLYAPVTELLKKFPYADFGDQDFLKKIKFSKLYNYQLDSKLLSELENLEQNIPRVIPLSN